MIKRRKETAYILTIILLITLLPIEVLAFQSLPKGNNTYEGNLNISYEAVKDFLPPGTPAVNNKGFRLNTELFIDRGIIVYGDYNSIPANDFKAHEEYPTLNPNGIPYYKKDGKSGEYRYHGFDQVGNKYTNIYFPHDEDSGRELREKNWIRKPWESEGSRPKLVNDMSPYNRTAAQEGDPHTQGWINSTVPFFKYPDGYNYLHVLSPPTLRSGGEGRMWHLTNGRIWYQTFSVPVLEHKMMLPVVASVEILSTPEELTFRPDQKEIEVKVKVTGVLQDEDLILQDQQKGNKVNQTKYYTRFDILEWEISLFGETPQRVMPTGVNSGSHIFTVKVPRNQAASNPTLTFHGTAKAIFINNSSSGTAQASQQVNFLLEGGEKPFRSLFTVKNIIPLPNSSIFIKEMIDYRDASYGEIVRYDFRVEYTGDNSETTFFFNTHKVENQTVNHRIYDFIRPVIIGKTEGVYTFVVDQTITVDTGDKDLYRQTIQINIMPQSDPVELPVLSPNIPDKWFDIVPFPASDGSTNYSRRRVYVDGIPVDDNLFFSGQYIFGESDVDRLVKIEINYESDVDFGPGTGHNHDWELVGEHTFEGISTHWVYVFSTKPRSRFTLDGTNKQNRKMWVNNVSEEQNHPFVLQHFPIIDYQWYFKGTEEGDINSLRLRDISDLYKEFLYKEPGIYEIQLIATNTLGRVSDPYTLTFAVFPDYEPAVILNLWNNALARNEELNYYHDSVSTDGDTIAKNIIEVYYDNNNDGEATELIAVFDLMSENFQFTPTQLGNYLIVNTVHEEFGEETLEEFVTPEDRKKKVVVREFFVDNFRPLTEMYIDLPMVLPDIDVYFMLDQHLPREKNDYIISNRMNINNYLRGKNIRPKVETWDMHTYVYSQSASTSLFTGTSDPPSTTSYSSGGYSGTLSRYHVSDSGYYHDFGHYETRTETRSFTASWDNTVFSWGTWSPYTDNTTQTSPAPSSYYINEDGYSGYIPRVGTTGSMSPQSPPKSETNNEWTSIGHFTAHYSGTLSKQVQVWVPDVRWVPQYTGYYSGTIYKYVRQPYNDPFRTLSDKYVVYISDGNISQLNDIQMVLSKADVKVILVGSNAIKNQIAHEHFILNNKPMEEILYMVLDYIAESNPYVQKYLVEAGVDTFTITTANYDDEGDPIIHQGFQYVQNQHYFNTPLGIESFARESYDENQWTSYLPNKFNKTGEFNIYRRIVDRPSTDPNFADFSYNSNIPQITVYSHRRPIALAELDWDYDPNTNLYLTTWVDKSFDWDHINSREDKGIVERKVRYRRNGGEWIYKIPDQLSHGNYQLEYYVKDVEGAWSDVFNLNFTLNPSPPIQMDAKARTLDSQFSMASIPASEWLEVYDAWTRYPYTIRLEVAMYQGGVQKTPTKTIQYSSSTGTKHGNDIYWNPIPYQIPETLPDGNYVLRVRAVGDGGQTAYKDFPVTVYTPINLMVEPLPIFINETEVTIHGSTTTYANYVDVKLYYNTPYESLWEMTGQFKGEGKQWQLTHLVNEDIQEGMYLAFFTAKTPNGNQETLILDYEALSLRLEKLRITTITDYNWKDYFVTSKGLPKPLKQEGIHVEDMPVYVNKQHHGIKLGYQVHFKIDSVGLHQEGDKIHITAHYYALDRKNYLYPVDIYVADDEGNYQIMEKSPYLSSGKKMTLREKNKSTYEKDPNKEKYNTWEFILYLPYHAKAVLKGEELDLMKRNYFDYKLLVVLEITGEKENGTTYDYTLRENLWGMEKGSPYGRNLPTSLNLLGKGTNHGEVFYYHLYETLLDDLLLDRNW